MYILNILEICKIRRTLEKDISHNLKLVTVDIRDCAEIVARSVQGQQE